MFLWMFEWLYFHGSFRFVFFVDVRSYFLKNTHVSDAFSHSQVQDVKYFRQNHGVQCLRERLRSENLGRVFRKIERKMFQFKEM